MNQAEKTVLEAIVAVGIAIRELGEVPSGHLYAMLMTQGCSLDVYDAILGKLTGAGLITVSDQHLIKWAGPANGVTA